jgi:hypothetical protein
VSAAPDLIAPIEAWRVWFVDRSARLRSITFDVPWPVGEPLVATCLHRRRSWRPPWRVLPVDHEAPDEKCHCGIYGAADRERTRDYGSFALPRWAAARVLGRVQLWGAVLECEQGWRASYGYPARLYLPTLPRERHRHSYHMAPETIALGLADYGVPVEFGDNVPTDIPVPFV